MSAEALIAGVASVIALVSVYFSRIAAKAAKDQTAIQRRVSVDSAKAANDQIEIQRQLRVDASQPYVWADIRPDDEHGSYLTLVVGNSGPTVATDVRVLFDPPYTVPTPAGMTRAHEEAQRVLANGLRSLPPGRTWTWNLGLGDELVRAAEPDGYRVRIDCEGPFGTVPRLEYVIDVLGRLDTPHRPLGTLNAIAVELKKLRAVIKGAPGD